MEIDKKLIKDFKEEVEEILIQLYAIVDELEEIQDEFPKKLLEDFTQKIDRIMSTAKTFAQLAPGHQVFVDMGTLGALCKTMGLKASTLNNLKFIPIFAAFWADTLEVIEELKNQVESPAKVQDVTKKYIPILSKRLEWLAKQIGANVPTTTGEKKAEGKSPTELTAMFKNIL